MNKTWLNMLKRKRNLVILLIMIAMPLAAPLVAAQEGTTEPAAGATEFKFIGAALAIGISAVGAGIAIYGATSAGAAAMVERPELTTWVLIFAALGEGLAIYGLVVAIMILGA